MYNDDLGTRMKEFYEKIPQTKLMRRTPVAIRIDGKAFHTFTKGFDKPFDRILMNSMQATMKYLCENIQGCVFGFTQSDEITLILIDYQTFETAAWFDYEVQKLCSVAASMATMAFNEAFYNEWEEYNRWCYESEFAKDEDRELSEIYRNKIFKATFDARCFNIPKEEAGNLIYWRQLDATRNSIQMVGQHYFSHKELQGKSCNEIQNMLLTEKNINWNNFPIDCKRGAACIKTAIVDDFHYKPEENILMKSHEEWYIDRKMPILKDNWDYINKRILIND